MTIIQLEYLLAVANCGSFSLAAEHCFVTQPSLSMQVKALEEELGTLQHHVARFGRDHGLLRTVEQHHAQLLFEGFDLRDLVILSAGNCMRDQIIELCQAKRDMPSHYSFESGSLDTLMRIVDCTSCLTIIPEMAVEYIPADHRDRLKMLAKGATSRKIAVAVRRTYVKSSIIKALTDTIMANAPEVGN